MRIGQTRVTLDSVVAAFHTGASAEEIAQQYSTLDLGDVYAVLGYYLRNRNTLDAYLRQRQSEAETLRESITEKHHLVGIRERLLTRKQAWEDRDAPSGI